MNVLQKPEYRICDIFIYTGMQPHELASLLGRNDSPMSVSRDLEEPEKFHFENRRYPVFTGMVWEPEGPVLNPQFYPRSLAWTDQIFDLQYSKTAHNCLSSLRELFDYLKDHDVNYTIFTEGLTPMMNMPVRNFVGKNVGRDLVLDPWFKLRTRL